MFRFLDVYDIVNFSSISNSAHKLVKKVIVDRYGNCVQQFMTLKIQLHNYCQKHIFTSCIHFLILKEKNKQKIHRRGKMRMISSF